MSYYLDPNAFDEFLAFAQRRVDDWYESRFPTLPRPKLEVIEGRRYLKLVRRDEDSPQRTVYGFVDKETGAILKAASWKAPANNFPRGMIHHPPSWVCARAYGIA